MKKLNDSFQTQQKLDCTVIENEEHSHKTRLLLKVPSDGLQGSPKCFMNYLTSTSMFWIVVTNTHSQMKGIAHE